MPFVEIAYGYLALILLLLILLAKNDVKKYSKSVLAAVNITLIFFVIYQCYNYYQLYKMAEMFGVSISFKGLLKLMSTNKFEAFKNIVVLIVPFVFLFKQLSANLGLTFLMLVLVRWEVIEKWYQKIMLPSNLSTTYSNNYSAFHILNYACLLTGTYALLYLLKRLPQQLK